MDIVFKHVYKRYGECILFDDFNYTFPQDQITCITGASGGGKTTLLRMLMQLESPDSGEISGLDDRLIATVFQEDRLCENLSAAANVRLVESRTSPHAEVAHLFEAFGLSDAMNQPARTLSGGMRRRVALARALVADYDLLLLDEPFSGLDAETRLRTANVLRSHLCGRTAIIVTHAPNEADMLGEQIHRLSAVQFRHNC